MCVKRKEKGGKHRESRQGSFALSLSCKKRVDEGRKRNEGRAIEGSETTTPTRTLAPPSCRRPGLSRPLDSAESELLTTTNVPFAVFPFSLDFHAAGAVGVIQLSLPRLAAARICRRGGQNSSCCAIARAPSGSSCFRSGKVPVFST